MLPIPGNILQIHSNAIWAINSPQAFHQTDTGRNKGSLSSKSESSNLRRQPPINDGHDNATNLPQETSTRF